MGAAGVGYAAADTQNGKPGYGIRLEPKRMQGERGRKAEEYGERESPPDACGESYQA